MTDNSELLGRVERLEGLLEKATKGPWSFDRDWHRLPTIFGSNGKTIIAIVEKRGFKEATPEPAANADLIYSAVNALPILLPQLRALMEERDRLREAVEPFAKERLSTEPGVSDLLHRSPSEQMRVQAGAMEMRDANILRARSALSVSHVREGENPATPEQGGRVMDVGDRVIVWPSGGLGLEYLATIERINGSKATVRPVGCALSKPAWADSRRARSVNLTSLSIAVVDGEQL